MLGFRDSECNKEIFTLPSDIDAFQTPPEKGMTGAGKNV